MSNFSKPENTLKRAEELIAVGQKQEALQVLHDLITSRRHRAWQKPLERIMFKYIELCVDMRRGRFAKDGLIQYRIVCQQVNVSSLEDVIKHFMHLANERALLAQSQSQASEEALDVEDLEADKRPEDLMLSYVSGEKEKERSDRELVTPWFKFLWETYRTVLEILRNNSKLEALYVMAAHRAFEFCKQYKRTTELRRLGDIIRNHLANLNKYRDQRDRPDLSVPETLQFYLDTRFEYLKVATELELWQESFRAVEDIYGLMFLVKKTPKASLLVVYYAKLTKIFWMSSSHLYHAAAWLKLFALQKSFNKNLSQKDLQLIASSVVLAALSVPPYDHLSGLSHLELENENERNLKLAGLIGFDVEPRSDSKEVISRAGLLSELISKGVMSCVAPEVKDLFHLLEQEFIPLDLAPKVQSVLTKISKLGGKLSKAVNVPEVQLSQYIPALEKMATLRLLQQVSQVYQTMKIETLSKMIPFFDFAFVEKITVDAVKHNFIAMKIDYMKGAVFFGQQELESDGLRDHLAIFAETLARATVMIYPPRKKVQKLGEVLPNLAEVVEKEHKRLLARKTIIEQRKEDQERLLLEREREEESRRLKQQKIAEEAEQRRLAHEVEQRKNQRIRKEIEERELKEAQAFLDEAKKGSKKKGKKPLEGFSKESLMELAISEQVKERQEMEKKLQKLAKTMDYLERAKREESASLVEVVHQQRLIEEEIIHERNQQLEVELSRKRHAGDLEKKRRLGRMLEHKVIFQERVVAHREAEFNRLREERQARINKIIQARKQEREIERKKIYYLKTEEERLARVREEEEARRLEDERKKSEEAERRKREEAEYKAKMDELDRKRRQRELEIEERDRKMKEEILGKADALAPREASPLARPLEQVPIVPAAAATAATPGPKKYVPPSRLKLAGDGAAQGPPPPDTDRRGSGGRPDDRWRPGGAGVRKPAAFGGGPRSSWRDRP